MYDDLIRELELCPDAEYGCSRCEHRVSLHCRESLMKQAADAIEELCKRNWISVEERLPEEGKNVLVCICADGKYDITRGWYDKKQGFCCWDDAAMESADFTKYWMQMPEPPREDKPCQS